ncbi:MAG: hypothetical protein HZB85_02670 [Deltaproteobacteria bacterium]|nr:hypothetical protein [Deltaproteobacteria bacterium]
MSDEKKVIVISILAGLLFIFMDTVIDTRFHNVPFFDRLMFADRGHELFMRLTVVALLEALGIISAVLILRRRKAEKDKERLIGELQEAITRIETLNGLLPICAYCKKVRDDQGYWNRIETYISKHSRAEFTHSICPECGKKAVDEFNRDSH